MLPLWQANHEDSLQLLERKLGEIIGVNLAQRSTRSLEKHEAPFELLRSLKGDWNISNICAALWDAYTSGPHLLEDRESHELQKFIERHSPHADTLAPVWIAWNQPKDLPIYLAPRTPEDYAAFSTAMLAGNIVDFANLFVPTYADLLVKNGLSRGFICHENVKAVVKCLKRHGRDDLGQLVAGEVSKQPKQRRQPTRRPPRSTLLATQPPITSSSKKNKPKKSLLTTLFGFWRRR